jgi:spore cortex formation protein SpoVR/YcgB (stage V sporulation)
MTAAEDTAGDIKNSRSLEAEVPKKLERTVKKLNDAGETLVQIAPALLQHQASKQMLGFARMGAMDKILGYLVTTDKNVHFVKPGMAWDRVQTVPLEKVDDVEYVDEFLSNTLCLKVEGRTENIVFYDDLDGMRFYRYIKNQQKNRQK